MKAILADRAHIAKALNARVISLEDAPSGYQNVDSAAAQKFVLDRHSMLAGKKAA